MAAKSTGIDMERNYVTVTLCTDHQNGPRLDIGGLNFLGYIVLVQ